MRTKFAATALAAALAVSGFAAPAASAGTVTPIGPDEVKVKMAVAGWSLTPPARTDRNIQESPADIDHAATAAAYLVDRINEGRSHSGLNQLRVDDALEQQALGMTQQVVDGGHVPASDTQISGYSRQSEAFIEHYLANPGTRAAIFNPDATTIGVGIVRGVPRETDVWVNVTLVK